MYSEVYTGCLPFHVDCHSKISLLRDGLPRVI